MSIDWIDEGKEKPEAVIYRKGTKVITILDSGDFILHTGNVIIEKEDLHILEKDAILDKGDIRVKLGDVYIKGDVYVKGKLQVDQAIECNKSVTTSDAAGFLSPVPIVNVYAGPPFVVPNP